MGSDFYMNPPDSGWEILKIKQLEAALASADMEIAHLKLEIAGLKETHALEIRSLVQQHEDEVAMLLDQLEMSEYVD